MFAHLIISDFSIYRADAIPPEAGDDDDGSFAAEFRRLGLAGVGTAEALEALARQRDGSDLYADGFDSVFHAAGLAAARSVLRAAGPDAGPCVAALFLSKVEEIAEGLRDGLERAAFPGLFG